MTRPLSFILACLLTGTAFGQSVLVNTRTYPSEILDPEEALQLDLREYFQLYPEPGPVATFTIYMPTPVKEMKLQEGLLAEIEGEDDRDPRYMMYELASGESYENPYAYEGTDFVWDSHSVEFNLLAEEAPGTVANFMTYAQDGAFNNTIVHRNESTGQVFRPGGVATFNPLPIIQAGGWVLSGDPLAAINLDDVADYTEMVDTLFAAIEQLQPITFEETRNNTQGTLAMARQQFNLNSASSQFFINLEDNTRSFGSQYSVFGELADPETDLPILDQFANVPVYDLAGDRPGGAPNIFPSLPFTSIPMYAPYWDEKSSYSRFSSISVPEGNPDGVTYGWEFVDEDEEEGVSEEEQAHRDAFDIRIEGSNLIVDTVDTGIVRIEVTGTSGGETSSFIVAIASYTEAALQKFPSADILQGGKLESSWYGIFNALDFPNIVHDNHGPQYVAEFGSSAVLMAWDENLESWIYTTSNIYPILFAYNLDKWVWYVEDTGNGDGTSRWFYLYDGDDSGWVREDAL